MVALVAMRHNDKMKALYERMTNAGKKAKVALVAVMRKVIICLNSMVKIIKFMNTIYFFS
ncbi:hypothetical protein [Candidatus Tisiphia endosymbiont of Dioctria rufipes]|uniref:hypothetical protein n=1 Tax=Candidatus Tisiphia endosymbiont of Dioctria rufipes TaxID=3066255 RepID=UPI00312C794E